MTTNQTINLRGRTLTHDDAFILIQAVETIKKAIKMLSDFNAAHADRDGDDIQYIADSGTLHAETMKLWGYAEGMCFTRKVINGSEGLYELACEIATEEECKGELEIVQKFYYGE